MPTVTDLSVGMRSVTTRMPLSSTSLRYKMLPGRLVFGARAGGSRHGFLATEPYLSLTVDFQHLHEDLISLRHFIGHRFDAVMRQLGNMDEPVGSRQHLHECPEVHNFPYGAEIGLADFHLFNDPVDHFLRFFQRGVVHRRDGDDTAVFDVDLYAAIRLNAADHFPAWANDFADLVLLHLHGENPRGERRHIASRRFEGFLHAAENVQPAGLRLLQRLMHQGGRDAADLNVHLQGRDTALGPADLEIHIAQMIFQAQNIG